VIELLDGAGIAEHPCRRRLDLHEPHLAGKAGLVSVVAALHLDHRPRQRWRDAVCRSVTVDDDAIGASGTNGAPGRAALHGLTRRGLLLFYGGGRHTVDLRDMGGL